MNGLTSKITGIVALVTGIVGILALVSLVLFYVGLFQNISSLSSMGALNDTLNAVAGFLSAVLASQTVSGSAHVFPPFKPAYIDRGMGWRDCHHVRVLAHYDRQERCGAVRLLLLFWQRFDRYLVVEVESHCPPASCLAAQPDPIGSARQCFYDGGLAGSLRHPFARRWK